MNLEKFFEKVIFEIGKYTLIPGLVFLPVIPTPNYGKDILFVVLLIINWVVLTEFKIRDMNKRMNSFNKRKNQNGK